MLGRRANKKGKASRVSETVYELGLNIDILN